MTSEQAVQQKNFDSPLADFPPDCRDCPELVNIPTGASRLGLDRETFETLYIENAQALRETPPFGFTNKRPFAMGKYEVTVGQFRAYVQATQYTPAMGCAVLARDGWTYEPSANWQNPGFVQGDNHPVVCVSPSDAQRYADWLSQQTGQRYGLPTELQWEYAARAWSNTAQPWAADAAKVCAHANSAISDCDDGTTYTGDVGQYAANGFNLFDMLGNVAEITRDCWQDTYAHQRSTEKITAATDCKQYTLRGGSWADSPAALRHSFRTPVGASERRNTIGFRVVRDLRYVEQAE